MGIIFDRRAAEKMEAWYKSDAGRETFRLQSDLVFRLLRPRPGERLLDVGCGAGLHLQTFKWAGLTVTGVEPSPAMLDLAANRLGTRTGLFPGRAEDLPFDDNEFDIVTLITTLEFTDNPYSALAEAIRVARNRVFVGVLNSMSLTAVGRRFEGLFKESFYNKARFFSLWELTNMIQQINGPTRFKWSTTGFFPPALASRIASFEENRIVQKSPFGSFLGLASDVSYTMRTDNLVVDSGLALPGKHSQRVAHTTRGSVWPKPEKRFPVEELRT